MATTIGNTPTSTTIKSISIHTYPFNYEYIHFHPNINHIRNKMTSTIEKAHHNIVKATQSDVMSLKS